MYTESDVTVVIVNYLRPNNIRQILDSYLGSSVKICVIDVGQDLDEDLVQRVDYHMRLNVNLGSYNRYIPVGLFTTKYCFFQDNDVLTNKDCIKNFVHHAQILKDFAVLTQRGRIYDAEKNTFHGVHPSDDYIEVDFSCNVYFLQTEYLPYIKIWMNMVGVKHSREDDIMTSKALKDTLGLKTYVIPGEGHSSIMTECMDEDGALCRDPQHLTLRLAEFKKFQELSEKVF